MSARVWIDGVEHGAATAAVSVFDHGFLFGDSVYEVLRSAGGRLVRPREHMERLEASAGRLRMELPLARAAQIAEIQAAVDSLGESECYLRIIITRGVGRIDLHPESCPTRSRIIIAQRYRPFPARLFEEGIKIALVGVVRNPATATDPAVKSGNYLNSVLALMEARERGADDGVMCNTSGFLAEGTTSNIFFVADGVLCTPALTCGILSGVTRKVILGEHAPRLGIPTREGDFRPADLLAASESFLSSTLRGVMAIGEIDGKPTWTPRPGPITRALMTAHAAEIASVARG